MTQEILVSFVILSAMLYIALRISGKRRKKPKNKKPDVPLSRLKRSARDIKGGRDDSSRESGN